MQYKKTIQIDSNTFEQIQNGNIHIKSGQWVKYVWLQKKSRFVGVTRSNIVWALHTNYQKYTMQAQRIKKFQ